MISRTLSSFRKTAEETYEISFETNHDIEVNTVELNISNIEQRLHNWSIPKIDISTFYQKWYFDTFADYSIKTSEHTFSIKKECETFDLLTKQNILHHRKKYRFIHIGLVQIAIKPLFRLGLDISIWIMLRDARHTKFDHSLLTVLESNIANGPIYSNCYSNFSVDLTDENILKTLTVNIHTQNLSFDKSKSIGLIYRV